MVHPSLSESKHNKAGMSLDNTKEIKCQSCHQPLWIDSSLLDLSGSQRDLLLKTTDRDISVPSFRNTAARPREKYLIPPDRLERFKQAKSIDEVNEGLQTQRIGAIDSYVYLDQKNDVLRSNQDKLGQLEDNPQGNNSKTLSSQIDILTNVFNILSSRAPIDFPMCQDCSNVLLQSLKDQCDSALKERDTYMNFLSKLESQNNGSTATNLSRDNQVSSSKTVDQKTRDTQTLSQDEVDLDKEKSLLLKRLICLEEENDKLDAELATLRKQLEIQQQTEAEAMRMENMRDLDTWEFGKKLTSLQRQYNYTLTCLDQLRKTNIYNETFKISHDGPFGTINGLRLGRCDDIPVTWNEINAAMGQVVLLLATINARLKLKLDGFKLRPMGSFPRVLKFDDETQEWIAYEAFHSENFKLNKLFKHETSFDKALVCLLEVIQQMAHFIIQPAPTVTPQDSGSRNTNLALSRSRSGTAANDGHLLDVPELPYIMVRGKINGISLKLYGGSPNLEWTTAMKFLLTNVKWLLACSTSKLTRGSDTVS